MRNQEGKVYKLNKSLNGVKQAPKSWNKKIDASLIQPGFSKCTPEYGVYMKKILKIGLIILWLYVDNLEKMK